MKLVAYLRVSTDRQAEDGIGLEVQEHAIRQWAREREHRLVAVLRDEGASGAYDVDLRPGLHEALVAVRDGLAGGVVVYRLDRLARKLTVQEAVLAKIWDLGGTVFTVDLGEIARDDPDDPVKTALRQMIGVFAQLERGMISARLRAGRQLKAERGGYAGYGAPRYGERSHEGVLVDDAHERAAIDRALALRTSGASLREIAAILDIEGYRPRRSRRWHPETLRRVLARSA